MIPTHYDGKLQCHVAFQHFAAKIPLKLLLAKHSPLHVIMMLFWFSHTFKYVWRMFTKDDITENATKAIDCLGHIVEWASNDNA